MTEETTAVNDAAQVQQNLTPQGPLVFQPVPTSLSNGAPNIQNNQLELTYYKSGMGSCRYVFKNGQVANFVNHIYATHDAAKIAELDAEAGNLNLEKATGVIDVEELTNPMVALENKIIREYLKKQAIERARANSIDNTPGDYTQRPGVGAASTRNAISADAALVATHFAAETGVAQSFEIPGTGATAVNPLAAALASRLHHK